MKIILQRSNFAHLNAFILPQISELHHQYLQDHESSGYDPDIHYPLLIILRKLPVNSEKIELMETRNHPQQSLSSQIEDSPIG